MSTLGFRVCGACGLSKPLRAFLQMNHDETSYGRVCADCRAAGKDIAKDSEEGISSNSGKRIDSKSKMAEETEHRLTLKRVQELETDEQQHDEEAAAEVREKKEVIKKSELTHRLFQSGNKAIANETTKRQEQRRQIRDQQVQEKNIQENNVTVEQQKTGIDFNTVFLGPQDRTQERFKSATLNIYRSWLGTTAAVPVAQKADQPERQRTDPTEQARQEIKRIERFVEAEFTVTKPRRGR